MVNTVFVLKVKSKTRDSDNVTSQPWKIDSIWENRGDAQADLDRMETETGNSFDFDLEEVDYYRKGQDKYA